MFDGRGVLRGALDAIARLGPWGPVLFVIIYALAAVLFIPSSVLTLGAGAVFGVWWGSAYVSLASTLGATAAFLVGRYLARVGAAAEKKSPAEWALYGAGLLATLAVTVFITRIARFSLRENLRPKSIETYD